MRSRSCFVPFVAVAAATLLAGSGIASAGEGWAMKADIAEACSCAPICPCIVGSSSTHEHCEGTRLVEIHKGHFDGVDLNGVAVAITFRMGEYVKYWIDDNATDEQVGAAGKLMNAAFPPFERWGVLTTEQVDISIERGDDRLKYSVPTATVEMEVMKGAGGKPIRVENLASPILDNYVQHVSVINEHHTDEHDFSHSGTSGFTSTANIHD